MLKIVSENPNYLAKVFRLKEIRKHPHADRLALTTIDGFNVITGLDAKIGELYVYFPIECAINKDYLSWSNSFSNKELNQDKTKVSFFVNTGRVRAIRLRQILSEGYIVPLNDILIWLKSIGENVSNIFSDKLENKSFDYFNEIKICEKYCLPVKQSQQSGDKSKKKIVRVSKIISGQYRLHVDTENLKRNIHRINPDDIITISEKYHGSNFSMGKVICFRPLNFVEKILKFLKVKIDDKHHDLVYSSRYCIKNQYSDNPNQQSYYSVDIFGQMAEKYKNTLKNSVTIYAEIVGQMSTGAWVQKLYDYSVGGNNIDIFVFRATFTNNSGDVFEFTTPQLKKYCESAGLKTVPIHYYGKAKDWVSKDGFRPDLESHWHQNLLEALIKEYATGNCLYCKNVLPREGVVMAVEGEYFQAYKLKNEEFLIRETKLLDSGEQNIEDEEGTLLKN